MVTEIRLPLDNPNDVEAEVTRWLVEDGQWVDEGDELLEVEATKAVRAIATDARGYVRRHVAEGGVVTVGTVLARVWATAEELAAHPAVPDGEPDRSGGPDGTAFEPDRATVGHDVRFSPGGQRELRQLGVDAELFRGRGLVTAQMVREAAAGPADGPYATPPRLQRIGPAKQTEIDRLVAGRAALASALTVQLTSVPLRDALRRQQPQPLVLAVIVHGLARLLREFPELNARVAASGIEQYGRVNVGVAVDSGRGLRVPVVRDADRLDPTEITVALLDAIAAYHTRTLTRDDLAGGTVTVSDLSGDDIAQFHPLINQDQTLALGVGGDAGQPGHPMTLTAVFDHRAATGKTVATFLGRLRAHLDDAATQ